MKRIVLLLKKTFLSTLLWKPLNKLALSKFKFNGFTPKINGVIKCVGRGEITFGKNVVINSSLTSNPIGGMERSILNIQKSGSLMIGDNTGISNTAIVCNKHVSIGKNVRIGGNTCIYDTDFHSLNLAKRLSKNDDDINCKEIVIKDGAFIGAHCIVLKGVTIGENSIVGAGSVVAKDVPDNEVWGGNPVKFIRKL